MTSLVVFDKDGAPIQCAWCQRQLRAGDIVTIQGRLSAVFGLVYCTPTCLQAHQAQKEGGHESSHDC